MGEQVGLPSDPSSLLHEALQARPRGLFTDIDGTISRIAPSPESATLLPEMSSLLDAARASFEVVAAVSGRAALDAARLVGNPHLLYIGNHGFETYDPETGMVVVPSVARPLTAALEELLDEIGPQLSLQWPGLRIERKGVTASIHVRETEQPDAAEEAVYHSVLDRVSQASGIQVTRGRMVIELRPALDIDKGSAVTQVIVERMLRSALYIGDDLTDVAAFRALRRLRQDGTCRGVSVAIHSDEMAPVVAREADLVLSSIDEVPPFFRRLLAE